MGETQEDTTLIPLDWTILGIVFALILFIIAFSGIALYIAFRIKEIFREEKRRGILIAKIGFLIGILFLAGGSFYFFATTLTPTPPSQPSNQTITPPSNQTEKPKLNLAISYPKEVTRNAQFTISFTITNPTQYTAHEVNIQAGQLLSQVNPISSTHNITDNIIKIGNVTQGTTISSLQLKAPYRPGSIQGTISLIYTEMEQPITREISISVKGGPP